ncbi:MAG: NAD-dependent epimerase [Sphingobacteriales bacterium 17-39-43]|uniref:NAD-dependent epimerase n=1 Tax=Daejeonella sp. TaxID=2805397 RepID=UPI000BD0C980|nr:NAD-dependent epimerase [Daejeonella sp.]OYZ30206.1 MAG: NAD-dependent epimerase [Sphingobacteriales bacterium 16-39-50]OZA22949.1 MAG: NAD-dependent epimerase [Sphingobacteriales bacterium 17-39-43]HQT24157.1 NAD-dependent epimerase [Daejeonella sp.]HQT58767.1 NAD-dependent epimerase [Daejeonella sp.]
MKILITGAAGFIGFHLTKKLIQLGNEVYGFDNLNEYYDVSLKIDRLAELGIRWFKQDAEKPIKSTKHELLTFLRGDIVDKELLFNLIKDNKFDCVINLAAQAGVRYSLTNPEAYIDSNIVGFGNILEACRIFNIRNLVFASSSSVYGLNQRIPFSASDKVNHPISLYAASKKSNELMAHVYSHLFGLKATGLRFFTVYGPWGRPDMATYLFTKAIIAGKPIDVFNYGEMMRDFTYVDDIVEGVAKVINHPASSNVLWNGLDPEPSSSSAPYKIYNIGNSNPIKLVDFIKILENKIGIKAKINMLPIQPGDVVSTFADVSAIEEDLGFLPQVSIEEGLAKFVEWYQSYYK